MVQAACSWLMCCDADSREAAHQVAAADSIGQLGASCPAGRGEESQPAACLVLRGHQQPGACIGGLEEPHGQACAEAGPDGEGPGPLYTGGPPHRALTGWHEYCSSAHQKREKAKTATALLRRSMLTKVSLPQVYPHCVGRICNCCLILAYTKKVNCCEVLFIIDVNCQFSTQFVHWILYWATLVTASETSK